MAPGAVAGQGQGWVLAGGDHQVHLRRQVIEQKGEGLVDWFRIDHVVIIQDQDEMVRDGGDFIEQGCQDRFDGRRLRGLERMPTPLLQYFACNRLQSRDKVRQKAGGIVIPFIQ